MRVLIATAQVPFMRGGAEILAEGLRSALIAHGHEAELVAFPFKWYPPESIVPQMLACRLMDLIESDGVKSDLLIGLKFPAYLIPHPRKVLWLLHQHRPAYDLWDHALGDLADHSRGKEVRGAIWQADRQAFDEASKIFTISRNVSRRLKDYCAVDSTPLYHPPLGAELFSTAEAKDYIFYPSRFAAAKRQLLVLEALAHARNPVRIRFASSASNLPYTEEMKKTIQRLGLERRVELLGDITEDEKRRQYAHALAVVYPPMDEDYGYVTLEAMLASKPVITCSDSGGPLEFIQHQETGLVAEPSPESLAAALDEVWGDRRKAKRIGESGRERLMSMSMTWSNVIERLLA
jgi:glycosyltransferase involved in cell wall biosynthesis